MFLTLFLGIGVSVAYMLRSLREKTKQADEVFERLKGGDLGARFDIESDDEIGQALKRFNRMADEVEHLVERVRKTEKARSEMLLDLAHDLRTPVTSLKALLEVSTGTSLEASKRQETLALSLKETDYVEKLVEDLLFLAQVTEPDYQISQGQVQLDRLIYEELSQVEGASKGRLAFQFDHEEGIEIDGDAHLLRRAIRNVLENATRYARKAISVRVTREEDNIAIEIRDDGPGFSEDALKNYGIRRATRQYRPEDQKPSLGLGSVIAKRVAVAHHGDLLVTNHSGPNGDPAGAQVVFCLPIQGGRE
jgi:K+-sensing histidine kinase KdpD